MKTILSNLQRKALYSFVFFLMPFVSALANEDDAFPDDTIDVPVAPIDDYIIPFLLVAIAVAFYLLLKQNKINQNLRKQ